MHSFCNDVPGAHTLEEWILLVNGVYGAAYSAIPSKWNSLEKALRMYLALLDAYQTPETISDDASLS
jgi:hypothetical protein